MNQASYIAAAAITAMAGAQATAQLTLGLDVNGFEYEFRDAGGASSFGGANHTGTMIWSFSSDEPRVVEARMGDEGIFGVLDPVSLDSGLNGFNATINLNSGSITGGSLTIILDSGDTYTTDFSRGGITALSHGGYTIDGMTMNGEFTGGAGSPSDTFGGIDVSEFNRLDNLPGWALAFRFNPGADATGTADAEVFVMVPLPPAALAGLGTLAGVFGFTAVRRRRMA
jgi:hypothetical protein